VRGCDLLESTPRQIHLYRLLDLPVPDHVHLPMAVDNQGDKLSKRTAAAPIDDDNPLPALWQCLDFLGQQPPVELKTVSLDEFWAWARDNWSLSNVPPRRSLQV